MRLPKCHNTYNKGLKNVIELVVLVEWTILHEGESLWRLTKAQERKFINFVKICIDINIQMRFKC